MLRSLSFALVLIVLFTSSGCMVGTIPGDSIAYSRRQSKISRNNEKLIGMKMGMMQDQVLTIMGKPEGSEGYEWGSAYFYRTAMTSGIYGTADSDFTPVVFDKNGKLVGWGRNFFTEHVKRYEIMVKESR